MKTELTLKTGAFYFLSSVNLVKGVPSEVDLSSLTQAEVKGIKSYVDAGHIESSKDLSNYDVESHVDLSQVEALVEEKIESAIDEVFEDAQPAKDEKKEETETKEVVEETKKVTQPTRKTTKK